jgi:hypothetical protein
MIAAAEPELKAEAGKLWETKKLHLDFWCHRRQPREMT